MEAALAIFAGIVLGTAGIFGVACYVAERHLSRRWDSRDTDQC